MQWLFKLASVQVLDVLQGVRVKPYRRIDQEGFFKRATSSMASPHLQPARPGKSLQ